MSDKNEKDHFITLTDSRSGKNCSLPVHYGTRGPGCIDIRTLYKETGLFTYDPGFMATGSCRSDITFIDGDEGILLHRGYNIEELATKSNYLEVCYLLLYGELPNKKEAEKFDNTVTRYTLLHDQVQYFFRGFRRDAHPMAVMVGVVGALAAFYHDSTDIDNPEERELAVMRMLAKLPTIAAWAYKYSIGQPFIFPQNELGYVENFMHMCFALPTEEYKPDPSVIRALERIFILHADHEQNASTSTVRISGSSKANPFACISAGICSLWGPAHGGANEAVLKMLQEIGHKDRIGEYIAKAKDKDDPFRLMGFGHRVYKNYDPRAAVLRGSCHEVLGQLGIKNEPLLDLAMILEKHALEDPYFVERKLFPNVDFYSGILLRAMGFPNSMFTVLFAVARNIGWLSQWREMMEDSEQRIGRPRQIYTGKDERPFIAMEKRS